MSNKPVRWVARFLAAGTLIAGVVVIGMGSSSAATNTTVPTPAPAPVTATLNGQSWIGG
jgi:hypothetical protein